jgi:hypothetical protein
MEWKLQWALTCFNDKEIKMKVVMELGQLGPFSVHLVHGRRLGKEMSGGPTKFLWG